MSSPSWCTPIIVSSLITFSPLWAMENKEENQAPEAELFIRTQGEDLEIFPYIQKTFTSRLTLEKGVGEQRDITDVGHVNFSIYPPRKECYISLISVPSSVRKQGHGSRLIQEVVEWATAEDCTRIRLLANTNDDSPIPFFEKCGFVVLPPNGGSKYCATLELELTQQE